ncbi:Expansin-B3 [Rhynchospora pubera]|uniref:Expansin-B3 n=1 Tax=Rhynchospora pubera TaxID=906938 RepID=A0AAV8GQ59_9POAL|nr:Expansin-B3 [Rhynchospora pubera]KAJ4805755.1 Expansin-B3 [Rhynchospora pubera]
MALSHSIILLSICSLLGACVAMSSSHHGIHGHHGHHARRHGVHRHRAIQGRNDTLGWLSGSATFYGPPTASGPLDNGGACGFKNINLPPFNSLTSCGSKALFKGGKGCGSCYLVKCTSHPLCSGQTKLITITDECLYGGCADATYHFDMSGIAFGSLALPGKELPLHSAGKLAILFKRVPCDYKGHNVAFHIEAGSNPAYLAFLIEYQNGEGDLSNVELKEASSATWVPLKQSWGKIWRLDSSHPLQGPFSVRLTTLSGKSLVVNNAIPADWKPKKVYESNVNFKI